MEQKTKINAEDGKQELVITREFDLPLELLFKARAIGTRRPSRTRPGARAALGAVQRLDVGGFRRDRCYGL